MPYLSDEFPKDDFDGTEWAANFTSEDMPHDPTMAAVNVPPTNFDENGYGKGFGTAKAEVKLAAKGRCQICQVLLPNSHSFLLHAHHLDRDKTNNDLNNLQARCLDCHAEVHPHLRDQFTQEAFEFIYELRRQQGIKAR